MTVKYFWLATALLLCPSALAMPFDADHSGYFLEYLDLNLSPSSALKKPFTLFFLLDQNRLWDENCLAVSFKGQFIPLKLEGASLYFPLQEGLDANQSALYRLHAECTSPFSNTPFIEPVETIADWQAFTRTSGCHYGNGHFYASDCGSAGASPPTLSASAFLPPEKWLFSSSQAWMVSSAPIPLDFNSLLEIEGDCSAAFSWIPPHALVGLTEGTASAPTHTIFHSDCRTGPHYTLYLKKGVAGLGFSQDNNRFTFIETGGQDLRLGFYALAEIRNSDQHGGAESAAITHSVEKVSLFKRIEVQADGNWQTYLPPALERTDENISLENAEPPPPRPPSSAPAGGPVFSPPLLPPPKEIEGTIHAFREREGLAAFKFESARQNDIAELLFSGQGEVMEERGQANLFPFILPLLLAPALLLLKKKSRPKDKRPRKVPRCL